MTPDPSPSEAELLDLKATLTGVLDELSSEAGDKFSAEFVDPLAGDGLSHVVLRAESHGVDRSLDALNVIPTLESKMQPMIRFPVNLVGVMCRFKETRHI